MLGSTGAAGVTKCSSLSHKCSERGGPSSSSSVDCTTTCNGYPKATTAVPSAPGAGNKTLRLLAQCAVETHNRTQTAANAPTHWCFPMPPPICARHDLFVRPFHTPSTSDVSHGAALYTKQVRVPRHTPNDLGKFQHLWRSYDDWMTCRCDIKAVLATLCGVHRCVAVEPGVFGILRNILGYRCDLGELIPARSANLTW